MLRLMSPRREGSIEGLTCRAIMGYQEANMGNWMWVMGSMLMVASATGCTDDYVHVAGDVKATMNGRTLEMGTCHSHLPTSCKQTVLVHDLTSDTEGALQGSCSFTRNTVSFSMSNSAP